MKKISLALLLLVGISGFAQNRFFYEYKFVPDSTDKAKVLTEIMLLDIDKKESKYYSQEKYISDSTSIADLNRQIKSNAGSITINQQQKSGQVSYKVTKSYPDNKTYLFTKIANDSYKVEEDKKPEWKILPDKQKIGEYNAQKATTNFGGRRWTAWFSTELPFQDGPYKFYGLPGLIVKLEDKTGSHTMVLVGNKTLKAPQEENEVSMQGLEIFGVGGKEIEITNAQFRKAWKAYKNDPTKSMREMMSKNSDTQKVIFKTQSSDGKEISDPNLVFREMEKRAKERFKKDNNSIEPDLY